MPSGPAPAPSDAEIREIFQFGQVHLRRATEYAYGPLREMLTAAGRPGKVVVVAVARLREVADRFGMQGLRDTAKFLAAYTSLFAPPGAQESQLGWSVAALFLREQPGSDVSIDAVRMRRLVKSTDLELAAGEFVRLELAVGVAPYDGVHADQAIDDAIAEANVDIMTRVVEQDGVILPMDRDWRPRFEAEYPG